MRSRYGNAHSHRRRRSLHLPPARGALHVAAVRAWRAPANAPEALRLLGEHEFSLAVVDLKIPGTDGIGLTREIRERWPDLDVIMITGYASIKGAVEAIKQGASDYITKPFQKEEILLATEKVLEKRRLLDEINYLRSQLSDRYSFANMVSRNRVMHEIFETIEVLAQNDATVLITGESGTGKELAARAIHYPGQAQGGPLRRHQLRRVSRHAARERALRLRARRLHRRGPRPRRQDRAVERRHAVPRRDREHLAQHAAEAAARARGARGRAARRQPPRQGQHARHRRDQRGPRRSWCATGGCARTSTTASTSCPMRIPPLRERIEDIPLLVGEFLRNSEMAREQGHQPRLEQGAVAAHELRLAGQRARARQRASSAPSCARAARSSARSTCRARGQRQGRRAATAAAAATTTRCR